MLESSRDGPMRIDDVAARDLVADSFHNLQAFAGSSVRPILCSISKFVGAYAKSKPMS